ncbi:MAG: biotin synthase BioB [Nitrospirota bacterium]
MLQTESVGINLNFAIDKRSALDLSRITGPELYELFEMARRLREKCRGNKVDLCSIINAKSGACPEDCSFCAQSSHNQTEANIYPLLNKENIMEAALSAKKLGAKRFCIVTSGKTPSDKDLDNICQFISELRKHEIMPCATLGMLGHNQLKQLKDAGLNRYHHNLESSEEFFSEICSTHTYKDKIKTIEAARALDLTLCSGGIFGLGESWEDRIEMAFALKDIRVDSVPINFFTPVKGTPLQDRDMLSPLEALKIIAIYRLIMPDREIRVCGGRPATLRDLNSHIFTAGADGLLIGNYLTTQGRAPLDDLRMIQDMGLEI